MLGVHMYIPPRDAALVSYFPAVAFLNSSVRESRGYLVELKALASTRGCQCGRTIFDLIARSIANAKVSSEKWRS
jgi:hypothetical protein